MDPKLDKATPELLARLEDPLRAIEDVSSDMSEVFTDRPTLQIDLTDPPSLPVARIGPFEVRGVSADDATRRLSVGVADALRSLLAKEAKP